MRSKFEIVTQKELEKEGWFVDYKMRPRMGSHNYNTDYFNLFDLMAYKPYQELRFISIKGTMGILQTHHKDIMNFHLPKGCVKEIWQYRKLAGHGNRFFPRKIIVGDG